MTCDLLPVAFIFGVTGLTGLLKPEWHAAIEKRRRTSFSNLRPWEVELSDGWYDLTQSVSLIFSLVSAFIVVGCVLGV